MNKQVLKLNRAAQALVVAMSLSISMAASAYASNASDIHPEVESAVWEENNQECSSVTLNGKEIIAFKGNNPNSDDSVEDLAEELADKLQDLVKDEKFDPFKLVPAVEGNMAAVHVDGNTVLKFAPANADGQPLNESYKLINNIRNVMGIGPIPQSFLKMAESQGADQAYIALSRTGATPTPDNFNADFSGQASWYGGKFHGRRTSNGDVFNQDGFTAAHRTLPFGTKLLVMNRRTGDSCVVQVNDRGPYSGDRIIDLSRGAAQKLNMISSGVATVDVMVLENQK